MSKQRGFTLIELMISSLIGLILMGGIMNLFITTNRSATLSDAIAQNQETGRFAMEYLTKFIRRAGYKENSQIEMPPIFTSFAGSPLITCGAGEEEEACSVNDLDPLEDEDIILGDRLGISYEVTNDTTRSCTGQVLPIIADFYYVDVFWVIGNENSDSFQDLVCRTYDTQAGAWLGNAAVSIINHVERFEFQVGLASDAQQQNTARYVNLTTAEATASYSLLVRSIRIAILTTSQDNNNPNKVQSTKQARTYSLLDAESFTTSTDDRTLRAIFMNTIELTNLIETVRFNNI
ncbi:MAG: PilW family protein [Bermanella sp.]